MKKFLQATTFIAFMALCWFSAIAFGADYFKGSPAALFKGTTVQVGVGGVTTLTFSSNTNRVLSSGNHTDRLPSGTSIGAIGRHFDFANRGAGTYTVQYQDGTTLTTILPGRNKRVALTDASTANGVWDVGFGEALDKTGDSMTGNLGVTGAGIVGDTALTVNSSKVVQSSAVTTTELGNLVGSTANVQTQLNAKVNRAADTMTGPLGLNYTGVTPDRAAFVDGSRVIRTSSSVSSQELEYLDGVSAPLQAQVDGKVSKVGDTMTGILRFQGGANGPLWFNNVANINWLATSNNFNSNEFELTPSTVGGGTVFVTPRFRLTSTTLRMVGDIVAGLSGVTSGSVTATTGAGSNTLSLNMVTNTEGRIVSSGASNMTFYTNGNENMKIESGGGIRAGASGASIATDEKLTVRLTDSTGGSTSRAAVACEMLSNGNNAITSAGTYGGCVAFFTRTTTADVTDTSETMAGIRTGNIFNPSVGTTYTHSGSIGFTGGVRIGAPANAGAGALAILNYNMAYIAASSLNTGTNKYGLRIDDQTGATNNFSLTTGLGTVRFGDTTQVKAGLTKVGGTMYTQIAGVTVANSTSELTLAGVSVGTRAIPANRLVAGDTIRAVFGGLLGCTGTPNLSMRFKANSTNHIAQTVTPGSVDMGGDTESYCDSTLKPFNVTVVCTVRSVGASGSLMCAGGMIDLYANNKGGSKINFGASVAATIDTTTTQTLDLTAQWDAASADNQVQMHTGVIEIR